ncbi:glycosyltransferase family 2 protein [uncultured Rhodoblastus sp.]|uniref:glycosyltransferase family 2 protein n=1 Tax=uncultured Rhodoblastus sp. TaxID=543037 RepID=UPI0025D7117A|nr:glycosyltransferase family 2 protein [uncultured Rhodoblastus sp.]
MKNLELNSQASRCDIHAIVLTCNEVMHLERCLASLRSQVTSITVVDSGSTDRTVDIARSFGAQVVSNMWVNYATQMNFAIDAIAGLPGWALRIDADEILENERGLNLAEVVGLAADNTDGLLVQRRIVFLGRRISHGSIEPSWQLRLWRNGRGRCELRWMDEHIIVEGAVEKSPVVITDRNLKSLTWWTEKHNSYASREAIEILNARHRFLPCGGLGEANPGMQARLRRFVKDEAYLRLPSGLRSMLYFFYRYVLRLGFIDGREGLYFHLMQGLWYRVLVDAKVHEIEAFARQESLSIASAIKDRTGFEVDAVQEQRIG